LPGILATAVDDLWLSIQSSILNEAASLNTGLPLYMTIALSADAARQQQQIAQLLERAESWDTAGYYVVCEHPNGHYLVDDPSWLVNLLDLIAGLRLSGALVILGYCNQQSIIAACANANAICSGTWMNVRSFPPEKFQATLDDDIKQRSIWYYCPQALSEYKIPFLDIARTMGVLDSLAPVSQFNRSYVDVLFRGSQPSSVDFSEQAAFRHYLGCIRRQCLAASTASYDDTRIAHNSLLNTAETVLSSLNANGVTGQQRDFTEIVDVNRAALLALDRTRGPILRHRWSHL
jgi:hypothetical protein